MSFYIDSSEIRVLEQNLGKVSGDVLKRTDEVLKKGAQNVKEELTADAATSRHFRALASAMSYDSDYRPGQAAYEVGPDKNRRGGGLGNVYYFGTSRGGGTGDIDKPLRTEGPELEQNLGDLAEQFGRQL
ncbi:hypothetical protein PTW37_10215 [Arthrobacter agilis]|uniref:hypothetical protein n=1 Tax=Arthrobacter agilis TaxID=37921 RepID=UPI0023673887|nr:hypothetical protein [Arthrobacter agilis]WDF32248.1 hypothetical protein PTW37_10215 [Arthrobacter agilis]